MLPIVFPQAADLLNFESAAALPELAPADAPPAASFSSLLGLVQHLPDPAAGGAGQMLPDSGHALPFAQMSSDTIEVTIDQPELETGVSIAALMLPAPIAPGPLHTGTQDTAGTGGHALVPASRQDALPPEALLRPALQPLERTVATATIEEPALDPLLQRETQRARGSAALQTPALDADSVPPRPAVAPSVTPNTPITPGTPVSPVLRTGRADRAPASPAPNVLVSGVESDTESLVTVERTPDARPALAPVETRGPAPFNPDMRERLPSFAEPQAQVQGPATVTGQAAAIRQPGAEMPASVLNSTIGTAVTDPEWGQQLAQRVQILASNRLQAAEIRLSPAELGPLRVTISIDDGAATVAFQAHHAVTRDAIEQALPRLREMLAENGLTLSQASVGEQGGQPGSRESGDGDAGAALAGPESAADGPAAGETPDRRRQPDGLVDTFA